MDKLEIGQVRSITSNNTNLKLIEIVDLKNEVVFIKRPRDTTVGRVTKDWILAYTKQATDLDVLVWG